MIRAMLYDLSAAEEGAIMRATGCTQPEITERVEEAFRATLDNIFRKGYKGVAADALIASGEIEVGRPVDL